MLEQARRPGKGGGRGMPLRREVQTFEVKSLVLGLLPKVDHLTTMARQLKTAKGNSNFMVTGGPVLGPWAQVGGASPVHEPPFGQT